jgi:hypothetical protein
VGVHRLLAGLSSAAIALSYFLRQILEHGPTLWITGGSTTGLSATDAWLSAAAGDGEPYALAGPRTIAAPLDANRQTALAASLSPQVTGPPPGSPLPVISALRPSC